MNVTCEISLSSRSGACELRTEDPGQLGVEGTPQNAQRSAIIRHTSWPVWWPPLHWLHLVDDARPRTMDAESPQ